MIKIYQGGSTGLVQQNKRVIMKSNSSKGDIGIQRQIRDILKSKFSFDLVIMQFGYYYTVIEEDADFFNKEFKFKLSQPGNYTYYVTGFPLESRQKYIDKLKSSNKQYCLLDQYQVENKNEIYRVVNVSTHKKALGFWF
jgi:DNA mismatch repair ATPase MutS